MRDLVKVLLAAVAVTGLACASLARAADKIGVVLMHGKQGLPNRGINGLTETIEDAGFLIDTPEMCWSKTRIYDRTFPDCLLEVDAAIAKLKSQSATRIVVTGMSLGGAGALAYGATHPGLFGVIGIAPAHNARRLAKIPDIAKGIAQAKEMVAQGKGDEKASFADVNTGPNGPTNFTVDTSARIYLSFFGEDAPFMPELTPKLTAPLLWVAGTSDPTQRGGPGFAFDKAPANPLNRYVSVDSDHLGTPDAARSAVSAWLKELAGK